MIWTDRSALTSDCKITVTTYNVASNVGPKVQKSVTLITELNQVVVTVGGACDAPAAAASRVEGRVQFRWQRIGTGKGKNAK